MATFSTCCNYCCLACSFRLSSQMAKTTFTCWAAKWRDGRFKIPRRGVVGKVCETVALIPTGTKECSLEICFAIKFGEIGTETFTFIAGSKLVLIHNTVFVSLPKRLFFLMIKNVRVLGSTNINPFKSNYFGLNRLFKYINGVQVPSEGFCLVMKHENLQHSHTSHCFICSIQGLLAAHWPHILLPRRRDWHTCRLSCAYV